MLTWSLIAAVATAGAVGGIHCAGMCGGMATMLNSTEGRPRKIIPIVPATEATGKVPHWHRTALLHGGRITTYGLMGAAVGLLGAAGMLLKPIMPVHTVLFIIGNLALIWLGLRLAGYVPLHGVLAGAGRRLSAFLPACFALATHTARHPFLTGMAWGCLPCGLLYGVLPFALLSGDPLSGAILMMVFGLATLPYLLLAQGAAQWLRPHRVPLLLKGIGAVGLVGFGIYGLLHMDAMASSSLFCLTPMR